MNELAESIAGALTRSYREFAQRTRYLAANLSDDQFWSKPYSHGNSFGHLTLHLIGNLNYYIGAQIAGTGYARDRDREFSETHPPSKEEALSRLEEAVEMVLATLGKETPETLTERYDAVGAGDVVTDRLSMYLRCATHFHHHIGQMIYLSKEMSK
jgi:uncharacterized damage-inducible protein DinB